MIASARVLRAAARLQIAQLSANLFMLFCVFVQPFFIAVTAMYVLRHRTDFDPLYVVVGAGLSGLWSVALFEGTWAVQSERWQGTLELLVASPAPIMLVVGGRMLGSMSFSLLSMLVCYAIGAWLFGYELVVRDPLGFLVSFAFGLLSLWSIAVLLSPIGILWRTAARFLNVLEYPVYILAGFLFPILFLPGWSNPLSYALPPYWAAVALHGTAAGTLSPGELAATLAVLVLTAALDLVLARALLRIVLVRAKRAGTLSLT